MKVGTEQEWQASRKGLQAAEQELEEHAKRVEEQRRELPWVPVEKEYRFATEDGPKSLPELFEGRSQLLIYHLMFGEDWSGCVPGVLVTRRRAGRRGRASERSRRDTALHVARAARQARGVQEAPRVDGAVRVGARR